MSTATLNTADELYNLCHDDDDYISVRREEALDRIRKWIHHNKDNKTRLKEALTYRGRRNFTPLHKILERHPPVDIIQKFIEHAPETLQMKCRVLGLPIHCACCYGASLEVTQTLVNRYPESVKEISYYGNLPLHFACRKNASLEQLNVLIEFYPEGVDKKDPDEETPLDWLKESEYAILKDNSGMLPLHHACNNGYSLHLIHFLIQAYPESTNVQDNEGNTPLQYLTKAASLIDKRGMLLLHREAAHCSGLNVEMLPTLFHANPEAIQLQDKLGLLPIHHASLNKASSLEALMLLVKLYPESIVL